MWDRQNCFCIFNSNKKVMKTLIIHPDDRTTDFLKPIYKGIKKTTVVTGNKSKTEVDKLISEHDRIMMMGHGSPNGLFSVGKFTNTNGFIIDRETVPFLQNKECILIWCHANRFVESFNLKGLYSGMFISEVMEAVYCGLLNTAQSTVTESNDFFANEFGLVADKPLNEIYDAIKQQYSVLAEGNLVAKYNNDRLYLKS